MHGSLREAECIHCGVRVPMADAVAQLPLPSCPECGEILKPGVVMFGEMLPAAAIERAQQLAAAARLLLVVGSSLEVYPVAGLPEETLAAGGSLAIVNRGPTPWDAHADVVIDGGAGETLRALAGMVALTERGGAMAERNKDLVAQLSDLSEAAIQRLSEAPGADKVVQAFKKLAERVDELSRRTKGYEELEHRLTALEKKVSRLAKSASSTGDTTAPQATRASSSPPATSVGVWKPASSRSTAEATSHAASGGPRARPRGREDGRDDRAAQRVPARPRRVERGDVDAVAVERRARQDVAERDLDDRRAEPRRDPAPARGASTPPRRRARTRSRPARAA